MPQFISKLRVPARVTMAGLPPLEGMLSLCPRAEFHDGPETLIELLNGGERVLPLEIEADRAVALLTRCEIDTVEPLVGTSARLVVPMALRVTREERVRSRRCAATARSNGTLRFELPDELNRASDFLNGHEDFFALDTARGLVWSARPPCSRRGCISSRRCR